MGLDQRRASSPGGGSLRGVNGVEVPQLTHWQEEALGLALARRRTQQVDAEAVPLSRWQGGSAQPGASVRIQQEDGAQAAHLHRAQLVARAEARAERVVVHGVVGVVAACDGVVAPCDSVVGMVGIVACDGVVVACGIPPGDPQSVRRG